MNNNERYYIDNTMNNQMTYVALNLDISDSTHGKKHDRLVESVKFLENQVFNSELLYSSVLDAIIEFNSDSKLVKAFGPANEKDFKISDPYGMTSYYETLYKSTQYMLRQIKEAQKHSITAKAGFIITLTDGLPTDDGEYKDKALKIMEYGKSKGLIYIALAVDETGYDCDIDLLKSEHDYVFKCTDPNSIINFFEKVVLKSISIVSQSVTGSEFVVPGTNIKGVSEVAIIPENSIILNNNDGFIEC